MIVTAGYWPCGSKSSSSSVNRQIVRGHWTFRSKRRAGRPKANPQTEQPVLRLAREDSGWGCGRIAGEMRKLGFVGFARSTVQRHLQAQRPRGPVLVRVA